MREVLGPSQIVLFLGQIAYCDELESLFGYRDGAIVSPDIVGRAEEVSQVTVVYSREIRVT